MASTRKRPVPFDRTTMLDALRSSALDGGEPFDVLVVGGGITGAGVALDAANRGLRTALIERDDFASGTSSKSSKLVHGGLRYLQNGDVRLVYEALHERRRLMRNAPHMVEVLPFLLPIMTKDGVISRKIAKALGSALWMYDLTGGWRIGKLHKRVSAEQAAKHFPSTHLEKLSGGFLYYDATADDARLTLTIARTAATRGAVVANRCRLVELRHIDGRVTGAAVEADGRRFDVATRSVVNASGVWADDVRALDEGRHPDSIRPAKGVHITLPWSLVRNDIAVIIPVRRDKRSLFLVPWGAVEDGTFRHVYAGTTDTDFDGSMDEPQATADDIDYILEALNQSLDTRPVGEAAADAGGHRPVTHADITGVWAGLRPLVKSAEGETGATKDLSRRHHIRSSESGVVTVTGGKLTTYREMAADAVDAAVALLPRGTAKRRSTKRLRLIGADAGAVPSDADPLTRHLARRFGSDADEIRALVAFDATLGEPLVAGLPYLRAEAVYAVRHEMATSVEDVLLRRTRAHLLDRAASLVASPAVAELLASELGWDRATTEGQLEHYRALCAAEEIAGEHVTNAAH
ncbi:MAG: glycerol-3-phosphate dehydrogenase/oxidase [Ilumatobacteraceae bacterium]